MYGLASMCVGAWLPVSQILPIVYIIVVVVVIIILLLFFLQPSFAYIAQAGLSPSLLNVVGSMHPLVLVYYY